MLEKNKIVFVVKGGSENGYGHAYRCKEIIKHLKVIPIIFTKNHEIIEFFDSNIPYIQCFQYKDFHTVSKYIMNNRVCGIIFDCHGPERKEIEILKNIKTVAIECITDACYNCNILIDSQRQPDQISNHLFGLDFVIIRDEFFFIRKKSPIEEIKKIAIICGGSSKAFEIYNDIRESILKYNFDILNPYVFSNYIEYISNADAAITAGGVGMYELAFLGIPFIAFPLVKHQKKNIENFILNGGKCIYMKNNYEIDKYLNILLHQDNYEQFYANQKIIDGKGLERILAALEEFGVI